MTAVTFDFGQTIAELDTEFVSARVGERGGVVSRSALDRASPEAWAEYEAAKRAGKVGSDVWQAFMFALLSKAGTKARGESLAQIVEFLWTEQPRRNLWRRPIAGMRELVTELAARRVPLAIISNSEGRLAELVAELDLNAVFPVVADSGKLGFEKPDARIFEWTAAELGVPASDFIHVGDAWAADVVGALGVGARAIWVTPSSTEARGRELPASVAACSGAAEIRATLVDWHVL